jgi:sugar phosphate isomerase/epimerase
MEVYVSSWSYRTKFDDEGYDLVNFVDEVHDLGADGVEIYPKHIKGDDTLAALRAMKKKADSYGMGIASLIVANDFAKDTAAERAAEVAKMKEFIGYAKEIGVKNLNVFTGYHTKGADPWIEVWRVVDGFREVAPLAEEQGINLCLENHSTVVNDADGMMKLISEIGSPAMKTNPDVSNFVPEAMVRGEKSLEEIYRGTEVIAPLMANAHVKIGAFTDEGEHAFIDIPRMLEIYRKVGYHGPIVLEIYGKPGTFPVEETCRKGIDLLRKYF